MDEYDPERIIGTIIIIISVWLLIGLAGGWIAP